MSLIPASVLRDDDVFWIGRWEYVTKDGIMKLIKQRRTIEFKTTYKDIGRVLIVPSCIKRPRQMRNLEALSIAAARASWEYKDMGILAGFEPGGRMSPSRFVRVEPTNA